ncbi:beta-N-acetylhexosaminidase [Streptomyces purpureus]|uniref:beta-N-acetylhexosaminidase n=1 Tax=Streptomyces purpureus TaxID=1951 RepID=UPI001670D5E7|nr:glycoside hydrolase family 20 protein [Streptomyces purpureus]
MWNSAHRRTGRIGGVAVTAAALIAVTATGCGTGSGGPAGAGTTPPGVTSAAPASPEASPTPSPTPTPTPTRTYALSRAPATVPAVRAHEAARGPGWKPGPTSSVVVAEGSEALADEGRLLAGELKIDYRGAEPVRAGDVELALAPSGGGPAESYTLTTRDNRVRITGPDEAGVFYGTRTVKQALKSGTTVPEGVVTDRPDRPQRGLNLDIARKHFTADWIEARLREMADLKLNQFGLHFSDDQGFRIASDSHPEVVSAQHLTKAEVRRILTLAQSLHITVVPEIDSPGHLGAVLKAHPQLQLRNVQGTPRQGAIDISKPESARIVDDLLREYAGLFPGGWFHVGADEYQALTVRDPQASYPQLAQAARQKYGAQARVQDLAEGWLNDRAAVVAGAGKKAKAWNDGFFSGGVVTADKGIEVEYWTGKEIGARPPLEYLREGRQVVNLNDEYLYYVLGEPNEFTYPTGRRIYEQWTPLVLRGTTAVPADYSDQILGARLAIWCDLSQAQTQEQVAAGIQKPLAALAQKVWDPRKPALNWAQFNALADRVR